MIRKIKILEIDLDNNCLVDVDNNKALDYLIVNVDENALANYLNNNDNYTSIITGAPEWMIFTKGDYNDYHPKYLVIDEKYKEMALKFKNIKSLVYNNKNTKLYIKEDEIRP